MRLNYLSLLLLLLPVLTECKTPARQKDVIKVMSYNVLKYGDGCQGSNSELHGYLKKILAYSSPDIAGLVKVEAIPANSDAKGKAPVGFADSILANAFNAAFPDKYAYCPYTNAANDNNQCILFYNKHKIGFASRVTLVSDINDFNMYKLYYLDVNLAKTHDTSFLYIVINHTNSGDESDARDKQMTEVMAALRKQFPRLPNVIVMGDFNLRNSKETGYQVLTNNAEKDYLFYDPPFAIDKAAEYPANWEKHPERYARFLTTSTRLKKKEPNDCGTWGGAKFWYDHILISPSIADASNYYRYVPGSYHTIGNDGNRIDASVNDLPNKSAPKDVLDALFHMSNKYPVMLSLGIMTTK